MDSLYDSLHLHAPKTARFLAPLPSPKGQLSYKFVVETLENNVQYAAISYVWGDPSTFNSRQILINGIPFPVSSNLHSALQNVGDVMSQHPRTINHPPWVWADQVCINQKDIKEKSVQVAQMGELYAKAQNVYICLGNSKAAQAAVHLITEVSDRIREEKRLYGSINDSPSVDDSLCSWEWYSQFDWSALTGLLRQPWFTRVWVIQEAGLAKDGVGLYGDYHFDWTSLMLVLAWLAQPGHKMRRYYDIPGWTTHQLWVSFNPKERNEGDMVIDNFLDTISHAACAFHATNPRDFIYAFLGHPSARTELLSIQPKYEDTVEDVYVSFGIELLRRSGKPYMLSCVNHDALPHSGVNLDQHRMPSWCPRWNHVPLGGSRLETSNNSFRAAISSKFRFQARPDNCLRLRGFIYDVIIQTFACFDDLPTLGDIDAEKSSVSIRDAANCMKSAFLCCRAVDRAKESVLDSNRSTDDMIRSFIATATAMSINFNIDQLVATFIDGVSEVQKIAVDNASAVPLDYRNALDRLAAYCQQLQPEVEANRGYMFMSALDNVISQRRLFLTRTGRIGIGPRVLEAGDHLCVIAGAQVPYVLRAFDNTRYLFVGESYVDGIMNGEAVNDRQRSGSEWGDIDLI